jgi:aromatic-L-amino-acid decarboxylase
LGEAHLLWEAVEAREGFEALCEPALSIVPFRHVPAGVPDVNQHNQRLADALQEDGRFWIASALIDDEVWLRPCFVNFRTTEEDVLDLLEVASEIGARLASD